MFRISFLLVIISVIQTTAKANLLTDPYYNEVRELVFRGHQPLTNYSDARHHLMQELYLQKDRQGYFIEDVYCNIKFRKSVGPRVIPSDRLVNIEHTWPQSKFNKSINKAIQKSDLHHLFPSDSRTNGIRGNHPFGEFKGGQVANTHCESSHIGHIDGTGQQGFEPPVEHKGNVARALFYFSLRYNMKIPAYEELVLRQWNILDPVDEDDIRRNDLIEQIQGNRNPFVDEPELADLISDF